MIVKRFFRSNFPIPKLTELAHVLAIQPHADDLDIALGATIAKLISSGVKVTILTVTDDIGKGATLPNSECSIRRKEQEMSAEVLGVEELIWLGYPDAGYWSEEDLRRDLMKVMNTVEPDMILYPDPTLTYEVHPDHLKTGRAAGAASILFHFFKNDSEIARTPDSKEYENKPELFVGMYYTDKPNFFSSCKRFREKKYRAIRQHSSQFDEKGFKSLKLYDTFHNRYMGLFHGLTYVEGIKILPKTMLHCIPEAREY